MSTFGNVAFDPEALAVLEGVFDEAWVSIQAKRNGNITRAALAERILRESAILPGYLMARSAAPKWTRNATASKRLSKKVSGKPFPVQMLLLVVQPAPPEPD
jgi:hypothetical protein